MSLYSQWLDKAKESRSDREDQTFWLSYLDSEKNNYIKILSENKKDIKGTLKENAEAFNMDTITFVGFLDGINTSLDKELDMESLEESTELDCEISFDKLYVNMLDAKAEWLYTLPEWDNYFSPEERAKMKRDFDRSKMAVSEKIGRNDPCPCGSGKKYKKCCGT